MIKARKPSIMLEAYNTLIINNNSTFKAYNT